MQQTKSLEILLTRCMFITNAFEIYGGVSGLLDLGPPGIGLKDNIIALWKKHFIIYDNMLQIECTNLTPHNVLYASGHVQRFNDFIVEELDSNNERTGVFHRADKLLETHVTKLLHNETDVSKISELKILLNKADSLSQEEMDNVITSLNIGKLSKCSPFNLMFSTTIGPSSQVKAYLRPETAQGIFVNFKKLLDYNNGKMPFASAQIGIGFRNEISCKNGLIRVREFTMAEIEYFTNGNDMRHENFHEVQDIMLTLFTADAQTSTLLTTYISAKEAVSTKLINNEALAYFMARSQIFFEKIGIDNKRLRFRQHLKDEMAHYASDCYDAEILLNIGWVECAGFADRACYDLDAHMKATGKDLTVSEKLSNPATTNVIKFKFNKNLTGPLFRSQASDIYEKLESMTESDKRELDDKLTKTGQYEINNIILLREHVQLIEEVCTIHETRYTPRIIEPSFGIGRILQAVLEHSFWIRKENGDRNVLSFSTIIAPFSVGVIPHGSSFDTIACTKLIKSLKMLGISTVHDYSGVSIGRKYSRLDEIGVCYVITLDDRTKEDGSLTIRERDTEKQIRVNNTEILQIISSLCNETMKFSSV